MVVKLVISAVIVGCCALLGANMSSRYVLRTSEIRDLRRALYRLEAEMIHYSRFLPEALEVVANSVQGKVGQLFYCVVQNLTRSSGWTVGEAWGDALDRMMAELHLSSEDIEIVLRFGQQLGVCNKDGQKKFFELVQFQLANQEKKAEEIRSKYERMYRSLGILGGLVVAIILF